MSTTWPLVLERGVAALAHAGERRSGDVAVFAPSQRGGLVAVIDGLGHGDGAADAAEAAARVLEDYVDDPPQTAARTLPRGAAAHARRRDDAGVVRPRRADDGVDRRRQRGGPLRARRRAAPTPATTSPVVLGGVVGFNLPQVRMQTIALEPGDAVVLATDGVAADFSVSLESGVAAQQLAERVLERHGKGTDDALAVVVRYLGPPAEV